MAPKSKKSGAGVVLEQLGVAHEAAQCVDRLVPADIRGLIALAVAIAMAFTSRFIRGLPSTAVS
jgi:hypothetical protein